MLVITTPTGQIGRQVLGNLLDSGEQLRVIARDPSQLPAEVSGLDTFQMPRPFCAPVMVSLRECRQVPECYTPPTCVSWSAHSRWRSTNFWVLPVDVFGSGPNSIASGHL